MIRTEVRIPRDHPALPGHFPGHPIVPAAVLLDEVVRALALLPGVGPAVGIEHVKLLRPLLPEETFVIELDVAGPGEVRFRCTVGSDVIARGVLRHDP